MKKFIFIMPLMAVSLLASCGGSKPKVVEHFVTFESYGGSHIPTQRVKDGEKADSKNTTPSRGHDTFTGWYKDSLFSASEEFKFDEAITEDITLYAKYDEHDPSQKYTVTFHADGADLGTIPDPQEIKEGDSVKETSEPTKGNLHFVGWYTDIEAEEYKYDMNRPVFTDLDLYARFVSKVHTVKWYNYDMSLYEEKNVEEGGDVPEIPNPTRLSDAFADYEFNSWFPSYKKVYDNQEYFATYTRTKTYFPDVFISAMPSATSTILEYTKEGSVTIDWGDGTIETNTTTHTYAKDGKYRYIRIYGDITSIKVGSSSSFGKYMTSLYLGSTITSIPDEAYVFSYETLSYIHISPSITNIGAHISGYGSVYQKAIVDLTDFSELDNAPTLSDEVFNQTTAYVVSLQVKIKFTQQRHWSSLNYIIGHPPY